MRLVLPERQPPRSHRFGGGTDPAVGQPFLDIAVAEAEAALEPDDVAAAVLREAMAGGDVGRGGWVHRPKERMILLPHGLLGQELDNTGVDGTGVMGGRCA